MIFKPSLDDEICLKVKSPKLIIGNSSIEGIYTLDRMYKGEAFVQDFEILIDLRVDNIKSLPKTYISEENICKLTNNSIDQRDLHINYDRSLCMGLPELLYNYLPKGYNVIDYICNLLDPALLWICYFLKYNSKPWEDLPHGDYGYLQAFNDGIISKKILDSKFHTKYPIK